MLKPLCTDELPVALLQRRFLLVEGQLRWRLTWVRSNSPLIRSSSSSPSGPLVPQCTESLLYWCPAGNGQRLIYCWMHGYYITVSQRGIWSPWSRKYQCLPCIMFIDHQQQLAFFLSALFKVNTTQSVRQKTNTSELVWGSCKAKLYFIFFFFKRNLFLFHTV